MRSESAKLLIEIAHCPNVQECLESSSDAHPCSRVVLSQGLKPLKEHQIPEPWSGSITKAPLLFLSSNPSISETEIYPRWSCPEEKVRDYFEDRFSKSIRDGRRTLQRDGNYSKAVQFWAEVRGRAAELYETQKVTLGRDYVLSEVVHCKSRENEGVELAVKECADRNARTGT